MKIKIEEVAHLSPAQLAIAQSVEVKQLEMHLQRIADVDGIYSKLIWTPDAGEEGRPMLMVEAYRFARNGNPSDVKIDVQHSELVLVSEGSGGHGPCWGWEIKK